MITCLSTFLPEKLTLSYITSWRYIHEETKTYIWKDYMNELSWYYVPNIDSSLLIFLIILKNKMQLKNST